MFQQLILVGNLGNDPEMRYTPSGVPVTTFSVAVNRKWTNQDGTPGEETTWFRVTAWRKLAETCNAYLKKGRQVMVTGTVKASGWTGQDGTARASMEVTADQVRFLGGKEAVNGNGLPHGDPDLAHVEEDDEVPF